MRVMRRVLAAAICQIVLVGTATAAPPPNGPPIGPDGEARFIETIERFAAQYAAAPHNFAKGATRAARAAALCPLKGDLVQSQGKVRGWTGTVAMLDSTNDGRGILSVRISDKVTLTTINNTISEALLDFKTLMAPRSPIYVAAVTLRAGQKVIFSGELHGSKTDCVEEISATQEGSMTDPEFLFRFSAIAPAD